MSFETSRHLQLHLYRPKVPFSKIVGKGHRKIIHEGTHFIGAIAQSVKQIFIGRLSDFFSNNACRCRHS
jgi:hypothetical protein